MDFNTIDIFQSLLKLKLFLVCGRIFKLSPESFWHDYMVFDDVFTLWYNKIFQIYLVLFLPQLFLVVNSIQRPQSRCSVLLTLGWWSLFFWSVKLDRIRKIEKYVYLASEMWIYTYACV